MTHNPFLRQLRARWMLSQQELAELLDITQGRVSRYEQGEEHPPLLIALALEVIFGKSPRRCFAPLYSAVEESVMTRAAAMERALRTKSDPASNRKRHLLESMMARATHDDRP